MANRSRLKVEVAEEVSISISNAATTRFEVEVKGLESASEAETRQALAKLKQLKLSIGSAEAQLEGKLRSIFLQKNLSLF